MRDKCTHKQRENIEEDTQKKASEWQTLRQILKF